MQIGMALPHYDFSFPDGAPSSMGRVLAAARRAEEAGFDSVWVSDHLFLDLGKYGGPAQPAGTPEAFSLLAALAGATERVAIGALVLCAPLRPAAVAAASAASVQDLSGGRLTLGLGAGWYEPEFTAAGVPFGSTGARIARLGSYTGAVRAALEHGVASAGETPGPWRPARGRPPIWVGGKGGPKIARIVAEHADGWNVVWRMTPEAYADRLRTLDAACAEVGRDPSTVTRSVGLYTLIGRDERDLARRFEQLRAWAPGGMLGDTDLETFAEGGLVGTPETCAARVKEFEALGVDHLILGFGAVPFSLPDDELVEVAARELLPLLR